MKTYRLIAGVLLLALLGASCPQRNAKIHVAPPAAPKRVYDPAYGVAVMVPEDYIDEAHSLIESEGSFPDFYDMIADKPQPLPEDEDSEGEY